MPMGVTDATREIIKSQTSVQNTKSSNNTGRATERNTPIVKPGNNMDKNAFLKILSAELTNQDPMNNTDSTQYVAQMAQFSAMEQMTNLNTTMSSFATNSLIGKGVGLSALDQSGVPYSGIVRGVTRMAGQEVLSVEVNVNGENKIKEFNKNDITTVLQAPDYSIGEIENMSSNIQMLLANSYIGKKVEANIKNTENTQATEETKKSDTKDSKVTGTVTEVFNENGAVKVGIRVDGKNDNVICNVNDITKILK